MSKCQSVSGQTYTRKADLAVLQVLSGIAQSASKFSSDIRLLSHLKEVDEPFEEKQIGSSAMANKRLAVPEAFLATDAILNLYINVIRGLKVYPAVIKKHLDAGCHLWQRKIS